MLNVDSIERGIVLDHIKAGKAMEIYQYLNLDSLNCSVAIIKNVKSNKLGYKDIIKVNDTIDINLDVLGYIDPHITVNIIENNKTVGKKKLTLPERIVNVAHCKNPRCISSIEQELPHIFKLSDANKRIYRCIYCDHKATNESK
ncbi:MAG: aspartate carbamoyltransferase regulatory subunit [Velocimicrobium sp.]